MKNDNNLHERINMNTSTSVINKAILNGYVECFKATRDGLYAPSKKKHYQPDDITIVNFYRFEGESDPGDNSILYIIETVDGQKGTLLDSYGAEGSGLVSGFMNSVSRISKK